MGDGSDACAAPNCPEVGEYRAPRQPGDAGQGRWKYLCLEHVRQFNAGYDFFDGMDEEQIFAAHHPLHGWADRTTWADGASATPRWQDFSDPLDAIGARFRPFRESPVTSDGRRLSEAEMRALRTLGLSKEADKGAIRRAYAEKLRLYHPDRNGGDRSREGMLQKVVEAYQRLRRSPAFA